jgi:hypothetical protein
MARRQRDYAGSLYDDFRNNPAKNRKSLEERMYIRIFTEIACARFTWTGLPDTIDVRFLELTLFRQALSIFYFDKEFDRYFALRGSGSGPINMYDNPTQFRVMGNTMVNKTLSAKNCVPIWANFLRQPDWDIALIYASKLAEIDRTIEIDLMALRHPFILVANDNERLSIVNAFRQVQEGQPVIVTTNALGDNLDAKFKLLDMKLDVQLVPNLQVSKTKIWNECMTFLGINNANQEKRERLVASEVAANNSQVMMARNVALDSRRDAAERINKMYDLDVKVHWNVDIDNIVDEYRISQSPGVVDS